MLKDLDASVAAAFGNSADSISGIMKTRASTHFCTLAQIKEHASKTNSHHISNRTVPTCPRTPGIWGAVYYTIVFQARHVLTEHLINSYFKDKYCIFIITQGALQYFSEGASAGPA